MTLPIIILFIASASLSLLLTPAARWVAGKVGAVDQPGSRKVHSRPIARFGGPAIALSLAIATGFGFYLYPEAFELLVSDHPDAMMNPWQAGWISLSLLLVLVLGLWDDIKTLDPAPKFLVQLVAATLIYMAGFQISLTGASPENASLFLQYLSFPLTVVWIIGVTNAFNLIDGLDGLASGVGVIALLTIASIAWMQQQAGIVLLTVIIAGALVGFLRYNFNPASIFLGDSGSLLLGFLLAILSIDSYTKTTTTFAVLVPVLTLGLPITDTLLSMARRLFAGFLNSEDGTGNGRTPGSIFRFIFQPDKSHIHHRLVGNGLSHRGTVLALYAVSILFGASAFALAAISQVKITLLLLVLMVILFKRGIGSLKYREIDLVHNGIFYSIYFSLMVNSRHFRKVLDGIFVLAALTISYYMFYPASDAASNPQLPLLMLALFLPLQLAVFWFTGLNRKIIQGLGIMDVVTVTRSLLLATVSTAAVHYYLLPDLMPFQFLFYVLNFYLLITFILGVRVLFHLLRHLSHPSNGDSRRVLIYGTGDQAVLALHRINSLDSGRYIPVGFLDERPEMKGGVINGYPVFGGHWILERIIRKEKIDEIHISDMELQQEVVKRIYRIAELENLKIKHLDIQMKHLDAPVAYKPTTHDSLEFAN